jgi:hypothetical protein
LGIAFSPTFKRCSFQTDYLGLYLSSFNRSPIAPVISPLNLNDESDNLPMPEFARRAHGDSRRPGKHENQLPQKRSATSTRYPRLTYSCSTCARATVIDHSLLHTRR